MTILTSVVAYKNIKQKTNNNIDKDGIRIPAAIIQEAHLTPGEELKVQVDKKGSITLIPIHNPQAGWTEAFNAIDGNKLLIDAPNQFDEEEWTW